MLILLVGVVSMLTITTSPLQAATGGIGGRPAYPNPDQPRTNSIFIYSLNKSESREDGVLVANNTTEKQTIKLYITDATVSNTGAFTCKQDAEARTNVGKWVQLSKTEVTLEPKTKETVPFTVTVPGNADVGEHNGCVVFQPEDDGGTVEGNVRIRTRSAIRLSVTVPGELKRDISIDSFAVSRENGKQSFDLTVRNNGNVSADIDSAVTLKDLFGNEVFRNGGGYPVIAGEKLDLKFINETPPFWGGVYVASASVSFDKRAGTFGTEDETNLTTVNTEKSYVVLAPSAGAMTVYALVTLSAILAITYTVYRRHDRESTLKKWRNHTVVAGDTVQSLADEHGVAWQKLAKMNSIKAPYTLEAGQKIKLPKRKAKR